MGNINFIDIRTLLINQAIVYALCTGVVFLLWLQNRRRFSGTGFWLAAFIIQVTSMGLVILRGTIPNWLSIIAGGYALFIGGTIIFYIGLERFLGLRSRQYHNLLLLIAGSAIHVYFSFIQSNLALRNINFSVGMLLISVQIAWLMLQKVSPEMRPITKWVGYIFITSALVSSARIIVNIIVPMGNDLLKTTASADAILLLFYQVFFFAVTFSLFLMINQRLFWEMGIQQKELKESEIRYRQLIELSPDALFVYRNNKINLVNPAAVTLLGAKSVDQLINKDVFDLVHPDDLETARIRTSNVIKKGETAPLHEEKLIRLDGIIIDVEAVTAPLEYQGQPALQTIIRDITERKQTEEKLHNYQKQLETQYLELKKFSLAIEQSGNIVIITDNKGHIQYANPRFEETSGFKASEVLGKKPSILKSGEQTKSFYENLWDTINSGQIWRGEFRNQHKNGSLYWEIATIAPVQNDAGEIINFIAIKNEITERKRLEAELEKLATTDSLTNTLNRRQLTKIVNHELERANRYEHYTSIIMLDIDYFKEINDTHGHATGDVVLQKTAKTLSAGLRNTDSLGRYGGDEFVIVLPETERLEAEQIAERLRSKVEKQEAFHDGQNIQISVSLGLVYVAAQAARPLLNFDAIIKLADKALYIAKEEGRNRVKVL